MRSIEDIIARLRLLERKYELAKEQHKNYNDYTRPTWALEEIIRREEDTQLQILELVWVLNGGK